MADSSSSINGFLDPKSGRVRSKEELAKLDSQPSAAKPEQSEVAESDAVSQDIGSALNQVRISTTGGVNTALKLVDSAKADVKALKVQDKAEVKAIKNFKEAQAEDEGSEKTAKAREELEALLKAGDELRAQVKDNNRSRQDAGPVILKVGNDVRGAVSGPQVRVQQQSPINLDDKKSLNKAIDERKDEIDSLKAQGAGLKEERKAIQSIGSAALDSIKTVEKTQSDSIKSVDEATAVSESVRNDLLAAGGQKVLESVISSSAVNSGLSKILSALRS